MDNASNYQIQKVKNVNFIGVQKYNSGSHLGINFSLCPSLSDATDDSDVCPERYG